MALGGAFGEAISNISNNTMMTSLTDPVPSSTPPNGAEGTIPGMINLKEESSTNVPATPGDIPGITYCQMIYSEEESSAKVPTTDDDDDLAVFEKKLKKLMMMKNVGAITEEEFEARKASLLSQIMGE